MDRLIFVDRNEFFHSMRNRKRIAVVGHNCGSFIVDENEMCSASLISVLELTKEQAQIVMDNIAEIAKFAVCP